MMKETMNNQLMYSFLAFAMLFFLNNEAFAQCLSGDCVSGRGSYKYPSGATYTGEFKDGEIHGIGRLIYSDGRIYIGEWSNRYQEGKGKLIFPDGREFKGYWKKGQFLGDNPEGSPISFEQKEDEEEIGTEIQTGCLIGDCKNGEGTMVYADGSKYEGNFAFGKINGFGTYYYANGSKYTGEWRDGYYHGEGTKYNGPKDVKIGLWQTGEYLGTKEDGSKKGCISGNCQDGEGTYVFADGSKYIGGWKNGASEGEGICYYANGNKYTGGWKNNTFNGEGTMYFVNGEVTSGVWEKGSYLGEAPPTEAELEASLGNNAEVAFDPDMKVYAVIVGVAKYNHMPVLNYTDDDAYKMYAFLMSPSGGALVEQEQLTILVDEDATKKNILQTMKETFEKADSNDMVMLYFSGHGFKGAFLPYDFDGFNNKLFHSEIKTVFNNSPAKFKLCIADACHSGSLKGFAARGGESSNSVIANYYKAFNQVERGTALLLSSKAEETSLESSGLRQGIFSHFLMRGLRGEADKDKNTIVTIDELYNYIYSNVRAHTGNWQTPVLEGNYDKRMPVSIVRQ